MSRWWRFRRWSCGFFVFCLGLGTGLQSHAAAPTISSQPQSVTNVAGSTVVFSTSVTGTAPLVYQWQRAGLNLSDQGRFSGTKSNTLSIASVMPVDAGDYRLVVTNSEGAATSMVASLTVTVPAFLTIPDVGLESALRSALNKPSGALTPEDLAALVSLPACGRSISNLSGLEWATNLTSLSLCYNAITNLTTLEGLNNLLQLSLDDNRISDVLSLTGLTKLTSLNLGENNITDATPLSGLTNLTALWLHRNPVGSLASLTNLGGLKSLVLFSAGVTDISPLAGMTNLNYLELRWNPLTNAETALANLTNLSTLYLGGTGISNVSFLQHHSQLSFLNLDHDNVSDLSMLTALPGLRNLDVGYNPLTNLVTLAAFTNLDDLYLSGGSVSNLDAIANLSQLRSLTLHDNQIATLTNLAGFTNLSTLAVSRNPITNWGGQNVSTNLTCLWLDGIPTGNPGFLQSLPALRAVGLRSTRLENLTAMAGLTNLVAIFAHDNLLTNINVLSNLSRLSRVQLTGNLLDVSPGSPPMTVIELLQSRGVQVEHLPQNQPPALAVPSEWFIATNNTSSLTLHPTDDLTPADQLLVTASSLNPGLIPAPTVVPGSVPGRFLLSVTPTLNQTGTAGLHLTVTDSAGLVTNVVLSVTVVAPEPVTMPDTNLSQVIGSELGITTSNLNTLALRSLTRLIVFDGTVSGLTGLEWATNLTDLSLAGNTLTNLAPLTGLTRIETLALKAPTLVDCSALASLTNLTSLYLDAASVTNLDFLQSLPQLTYLTLIVPRATALSPLAGLTNLFALQLSANLGNNFTFLQGLNRLISLTLSECRLSDLSTLAPPAALQVLEVHRNRLTDVAPLTNWSSLAYLNLRYNLLETNHPTVQVLKSRVPNVFIHPQRVAPELDLPAAWLGAANASTHIPFRAWDDGASPTEQLGVTIQSSNPGLVPGVNLFAAPHSDPLLQHDWILTVIPPPDLSGTITLSLIVTNDVGLSVTRAVQLEIVIPAALDTGLLEAPDLTWQTGGHAPWFGQSQISHDGISSAQSGSILDLQESWMETVITGPCILSFWWQVSSEANFDWLEFRRNGVLQQRISGEADWQQVQVSLPAGAQTLRWRYFKDKDTSRHLDAAWLDQVSVAPAATIALSNLSQTYNGTGHPVAATTTPPGLPVSLAYNGSSSAPTNAGTYQVIATINDTNYYGTTTNTLVIGKAPLTVAAENKMKAVGLPVPPLTLQYTGFFAGDNTNVVDSPPAAATTATNNSPPGNFPINVTGGSASNYTLNRVPGILIVTNGPLLILSLTGAGTTNAVVTWTSVHNRTYELQYQSVFGGAWLPLATNITATDWITAAVAPSGASSQRFYRVKQLSEAGAPGIYTNAPPVILSLTGPGTASSVLTWSSISNVNYRVLYASDLNTPWFTLTPDVRATNTTASAVDQTVGVERRYYRVMVVP